MTSPLARNGYLTSKLFARYLLPSILSLVASSLNSLIDTAIVSNFSSIDGLSAMSIVAPVNLLYLTIGSTICVGASICFSSAVGEKKFEKARAYFGFAIAAVLAVGIVLTATLTPFSYQLASLLGAKEGVLPQAQQYLFWYFCGGAFVMMIYIPHNFSKALGKPNVPLILLSVMAVVNVGLTYLFVAVLGMGTGGAALGTVIASAVTFGLGCFFIFDKKSKLTPIFFRLPVKEWKNTLFCGSAAGFNNFIGFIIVFGINAIIGYIAVSQLLPAYSIGRTVQDLLMSIVLGISQSVMPLVAMFRGERDNQSVRLIVKKAMLTGLIIVSVSIVVAIVLRSPLQRLFGTEPTPDGTSAVVLMCLALLPSFINILLISYFSAIKKYRFSQIIMLLRACITLLFAFVLGRFINGNALWWCFVSAEIVVLCIFVLLIVLYCRKHKELDFFLLEKKYDQPANRLSFSIRAQTDEIVSIAEKASEFFEEKGMSPKILMRINLSIEELLIAIVNQKHILSHEYVDISIFYDNDGVILRFRYGGKRNNPFVVSEYAAEEDAFGVEFLKKAVNSFEYYWLFGLNHLVVIL